MNGCPVIANAKFYIPGNVFNTGTFKIQNVLIEKFYNFDLKKENVTSSAKPALRRKRIVSSWISCFHTFVRIFMVETAQVVTKMFTFDVHQ